LLIILLFLTNGYWTLSFAEMTAICTLEKFVNITHL
jgi:hypothetical protein